MEYFWNHYTHYFFYDLRTTFKSKSHHKSWSAKKSCQQIGAKTSSLNNNSASHTPSLTFEQRPSNRIPSPEWSHSLDDLEVSTAIFASQTVSSASSTLFMCEFTVANEFQCYSIAIAVCNALHIRCSLIDEFTNTLHATVRELHEPSLRSTRRCISNKSKLARLKICSECFPFS